MSAIFISYRRSDAEGQAGRWEVEPGGFGSSGGVISVDQGVDVPCFTSDNRPCTFQVRVEPQGEMFVSVALYK